MYIVCKTQPRSQGSLLPAPMGAGRREPWERGCAKQSMQKTIGQRPRNTESFDIWKKNKLKL